MFEDSRSPATAFPATDVAQWRAQVEADLKGRGLESLRSTTEDGLVIEPLYTRADAISPGLPSCAGFPPQRRALIHEDGGDLVGRVREEVRGGATAVQLVLAAPGRSRGLVLDPGRWSSILAELEDVPLVLDALDEAFVHARPWRESIAKRSIPMGLGLDPFSMAARAGANVKEALQQTAQWLSEGISLEDRLAVARIDTAYAHQAGATTAQSLGVLLANFVALLRAAEEQNIAPSVSHRRLEFTVRIDTRFFESLATLRAARHLHARVLEALGVVDVSPMFLFARPSGRIATRRDPWVNLLRQTTTTFAALVGGADAVAAVAYDHELANPAELGRRIARNTPIILEEESHLRRVEDPAAGSWFLESFTRDLAAEAWAFFQQIESEGGAVAVLESGWLRERVDAAHEQRRKRIATRKLALCGVSEFPDPSDRTDAAPSRHGAAAASIWPSRRLAGEFETLRDAADAHALTLGRAPAVYLATLGNVADHTARTTWTTNLLSAGGVHVEATSDSLDAVEQSGRFAESGCRVAVLCSSDDLYADHASNVARALKRAGAHEVWLAGRPGEHENAWRSAGIDRFVHVGIDVLDALGHLHTLLGVRS